MLELIYASLFTLFATPLSPSTYNLTEKLNWRTHGDTNIYIYILFPGAAKPYRSCIRKIFLFNRVKSTMATASAHSTPSTSPTLHITLLFIRYVTGSHCNKWKCSIPFSMYLFIVFLSVEWVSSFILTNRWLNSLKCNSQWLYSSKLVFRKWNFICGFSGTDSCHFKHNGQNQDTGRRERVIHECLRHCQRVENYQQPILLCI